MYFCSGAMVQELETVWYLRGTFLGKLLSFWHVLAHFFFILGYIHFQYPTLVL